MYLKRLEIKGFKSFADKIELDFGTGITAVVGPNGSGKSNIADAVRWVLGEQSAKALRGSRMEDVIFAGTENRKALGFAEVSITLDNRDNLLPIDYSEVMVTRRVYRSGESEYYLNRTGCRLKDIVELFMDTGIGKEGYSIIGQGRIDEILSSKAEDRRRVFEEAAGIVKYKTRKEEAEKKLEKTRENLVRLEDILEELQRQMDPLYRQSEIAKKYIKLKESLKELELNILVRNIEKLNAKKEQLTQQLKEYQRAVYDKNNVAASLESALNSLKNRVRQLDEELKETRERLYSTLNYIEKKEGDIKVVKQKIESIKGSNDIHRREISKLYGEIERLEGEKEEKEKTILSLKEAIEDKRRLLDAFQNNLDSIGIQVGEEEGEIEELKSQIIDNLNSISEYNSRVNSLKVLNDSILKRKQQVLEEIQQVEEYTKTAGRDIESLKSKLNEMDRQLQQLGDRRNSLRKALDEVRDRKQRMQQQCNVANNKLKSALSKLQVLQEMEKGYEGYSRSVKSLLEACSRNTHLSQGIIGTVARLIEVPEDLERAIEVALGYSLQHIVTRTEEDAKKAIDYLKSRELGRATFLPISSVKPRRLDKKELKVLNMKGCIGIASRLVKCPDNVRNVIDNLLGRIVIVDTLDNGIAMARAFRYSFRIVTLEGDVLSPGGAISGGSSLSKEIGLLQRKREIERLSKAVSVLERSCIEHEIKREQAVAEEKEIEEKLERLQESIHNVELDKTGVVQSVQSMEKDVYQYREKLLQLNREKEDLESDYLDTLSSINGLYKKIKEIEDQNKAKQERIKLLQKTSNERKQDRENILQQITTQRVEIARLGQKLEDLQEGLRETLQAIQKHRQSILEREGEIQLNKNNIQQLENQISVLKQEIERMVEGKNRDNQEIIKLQQLKTSCYQRIEEKEDAVKEIRNEVSRIEEKYHRAEVQLTRAEVELNNLHDRMWQEYEITFIEAMDYKKDIDDLKKAEQEVSVLKNKIKSLGNVNVNAIEEYERLKERYDFLVAQKEDLVNARNSLTKVIQELVASMKKQFSEQFKVINQKFSQVFSELFGGGKAQLVLTDEDNVLESGVDIVAQPPGKKLQHLSLLSGGERALTAIALLFAILMVKPTPFCILDEIEAALDDANVERFASFLKKLSRDTQFIIITHRRGTMEAADALYGVTMEEKGISKLVSVKLEDKAS